MTFLWTKKSKASVCQSATRNDEDDDDQMGDGNESRSKKTKKEKSKMKYFAFLMINCIFLSSATTRDKS